MSSVSFKFNIVQVAWLGAVFVDSRMRVFWNMTFGCIAAEFVRRCVDDRDVVAQCDGKRVDVVNEVSVCVAASNSRGWGGGGNQWMYVCSCVLCSGWVQHNVMIVFWGRFVTSP